MGIYHSFGQSLSFRTSSSVFFKVFALIICISFMCMEISVFPSFATLSAMYISLSLKYE